MLKSFWGAVVVAQLVEHSLPIPEVRGSNPVIEKNYIELFNVNCIEKTKIKKKRPRMAHLKKLVKSVDPTTSLCTYWITHSPLDLSLSKLKSSGPWLP